MFAAIIYVLVSGCAWTDPSRGVSGAATVSPAWAATAPRSA
ncbi:hypothetical protein [Streptomyces coeruleorubidus]